MIINTEEELAYGRSSRPSKMTSIATNKHEEKNMSEEEIKAALSISTEVQYGIGDDGDTVTIKLMWNDEVIDEDYFHLNP